VHDSGPGIPDSIRCRNFDPFFTTNPVGTGTGLGLSISNGIVSAHRGEIAVESDPWRGTTYRVILPAAVPEPLPPARGPILTPVPAACRSKVLIVDDEPVIARVLSRILADEHDAVVALNGREVLDRIRAGEHFDVILCDLMMPDLSGMDLYSEIKGIAADLADRIIFVTGGAFTPSAAAFLDAVHNARFDKPFDAANVRALVRGIASTRR
jgi:CheY-like chemotaxis protein